jgi:chromosome segregation ATPase
MSFDTLAYTRRLRDAGIPSEQAEAHAEALKAALADEVATKHDVDGVRRDIKDLETALGHDLQNTEAALRTDIAALRHDLEATEATLRHDLQGTEAVLRAEIAAVDHKMEVTEANLRRGIAEAKNDIIKWLVSIALALFVALVSIAVRLWTA